MIEYERVFSTRYSREAMDVVRKSLPNDEGILKRLERALRMVFPHSGYSFYESKVKWRVNKLATSLLDEDTDYHVTEEGCSCPDGQNENTRAGLCKHRLAIRLIIVSNQLDDRAVSAMLNKSGAKSEN